MTRFACLAAVVLLAKLTKGQMLPPPVVQTTGWNSSFKFTPEQLELGNLTEELGGMLETIINFDRSQLVNGGPSQDDFYNLPPLTEDEIPTAPGKLIKLQEVTNPLPYVIPSKTAISRFIYSSTNLNGTLLPASAYVLWPYQARKINCAKDQAAKAPVVLWTHGTSGFYPSGGPSTHRALFYGDFMPFALAQAGYIVVAADYAGLGVGKSWDGSTIPHQYLAAHAGAFDALNALKAAHEAFPDRLTSDYVVVGHSQGGAVAWGVSEVLAEDNTAYNDLKGGHLGTVTFAPGQVWPAYYQTLVPWIGKALNSIYPDFTLSDWMTPIGVARTELLDQVEGGQLVSQYLFQDAAANIRPDWNESWYKDAYQKLTNLGNHAWKGPMLLLQGTVDPGVNYNTTKDTFERACKSYPGDLEFVTVPGAGHFPVMDASRLTWLKWIEDRFSGKKVANSGCTTSELNGFLPLTNYQAIPNSFPQWAGAPQFFYELPTAA